MKNVLTHLTCIVLPLLLWAGTASAQVPATITYADISSGNTWTEPIEQPQSALRHRLEKGVIVVELNLYGNNGMYTFDHTGGAATVTVDVQLVIKNSSSTVLLDDTKTLEVTEEKPQQVWALDITDLTDPADFDLNISAPVISGGAAPADIQQVIRMYATDDMDYKYGVRDAATLALSPPVQLLPHTVDADLRTQGRVQQFRWTDPAGHDFQNYELQLLRLYNTNPANNANLGPNQDEPNAADALVDWSTALSIQTESPGEVVELTVAEGSGFYVWRVRPIGDFYEGGIANHRNWGAWSTHIPNSGTATVAVTIGQMLQPDRFYLVDPDADRNWIYSRTFTEGMKTHEQMVIGDPLQNPRQTQVYLSTEDTRMVAQNVLDYSGRPAVVSLPVPVDGKLEGYIPSLVTDATNGEVYTARHFDTNNGTPTPVDQSVGTHQEYYSDNNGDLSVPDAQGYPLTRATYKTDGTNRITEQGSPGRTHMIGDQTNGMGRTVRTSYAEATLPELVRIFGDEAPEASKVLKVITTDPNNITSVAYIGEGGNTIATALTINEDDDILQKLESEELAENTFTIEHETNDNTEVLDGLVSSVRLDFHEETPINVTYTISCKTFANACVSATADCGFVVRLSIERLDDNSEVEFYEEAIDISTGCNNGEKEVRWRPAAALPSGDYRVVKKLIVTGSVSQDATAMVNAGDAMWRPLVDMVAGWMSQTYSQNDVQSLYNEVNNFNNDLSDVIGGSATPESIRTKYALPSDFMFDASHALTLTPAYDDNNPTVLPEFLEIQGCCADPILVPLTVPAPVTYDCTGSPIGFEQYLIDELNILTEGTWNNLMPGYHWQQGDFDAMVGKMLTDQYDYMGEMGPHYECDDLWTCWTAIVGSASQIAQVQMPNNISTAVDDEVGDTGEAHDSNFDDNAEGGGKLVKWLIKKALSNRMRDDLPPVDVDLNLPELFLQCAGYKFANMVVVNSSGTELQGPLAADATEYWDPILRANAYKDGDQIYDQIENPLFAFKYFEYVDGANPTCEQMHCYWGPTQAQVDALQGGINALCIDDPCIDQRYDTWNQTQEADFLNCLKVYKGMDDPTELEPDPTVTCNDIVTILALPAKRTTAITNCQSDCEARKGEWMNALAQEFLSKCYTIEEGCPDDPAVVTWEDIEAIADTMVANCQSNYCPQVDPNYPHCNLINNCYVFDYETRQFVVESEYFTISITTDCEKDKMAMVTTWEVEVSIPSLCTGEEGDLEQWAGVTNDECDPVTGEPLNVTESNSNTVTVSSGGN